MWVHWKCCFDTVTHSSVRWFHFSTVLNVLMSSDAVVSLSPCRGLKLRNVLVSNALYGWILLVIVSAHFVCLKADAERNNEQWLRSDSSRRRNKDI